ncbi:MAG: hypothetical protein HUK03_00505 [Bacteroidaceae bacterium]|nr:hypothetical protein [Bacteroidaceae bacterium]
MRRLLPVVVLAILLAACGGEKRDTFTHTSARSAAERYYAMLIAGDYGGFIDASHVDSVPDDYRQESIDMLAQYMEVLLADRGSIVSAKVSSDTIYEDSLADVFVDLCFGDSSCEKVLVPMVLHDGRWVME